MTLTEITARKHELDKIIRNTLTIHVKSDILKTARAELLKLQEICPHKADEEICPFCGKKK